MLSIYLCLRSPARGLARSRASCVRRRNGPADYGISRCLSPLALRKRHAAVLFVHNLGVEVALWTVGVACSRQFPWREIRKRLLSPPLVAIVLALLVTSAGRAAIPSFASDVELSGGRRHPPRFAAHGRHDGDEAPSFGARAARVSAGLVRAPPGRVAAHYLTGCGCCQRSWSCASVRAASRDARGLSSCHPDQHYGATRHCLTVVFATTLASMVTLPCGSLGSRWLPRMRRALY